VVFLASDMVALLPNGPSSSPCFLFFVPEASVDAPDICGNAPVPFSSWSFPFHEGTSLKGPPIYAECCLLIRRTALLFLTSVFPPPLSSLFLQIFYCVEPLNRVEAPLTFNCTFSDCPL